MFVNCLKLVLGDSFACWKFMSKPLTVVSVFNYLIVMQTPFRTDIQYVKHMVMICDFD